MLKNFFMLSKVTKIVVATMICVVVVGFVTPVLALENSFVTIVNPVRGKDFWGLEKQEPLTAVEGQLKIIRENNFSATWLLRPDAILDAEISNYFKNFSPDQELGIFLEVTPSWARQAEVEYHNEALWHYANSVFLSGYTVGEREKLIDTAFERFKEIFGFYPQAVGAWHIDANSLAYMEKNYGITAALICADQFLTDDYQIWGGWWSVPYYPSRYHSLVPAQSKRNKLEVVIFQWAARDPVNGYGGGLEESTFSIQANDYLKHGLDTSYFSKLVDVYLNPAEAEFGQITVGLENDNSWKIVGEEYRNQIKILATKKAKTLTMSEFSLWYKEKFPYLSPFHQIETIDPLGTGKKATWLMSTKGRLGILTQDGKEIVRDWRLYNEKWAEPYREVANKSHQLKISLPAEIDSVRFPNQAEKLTKDPHEFLQEKGNFPFETSKIIFVLMALIFISFLFWGFRLNKWLPIVVVLGMASQIMTMVKSGLLYSYGMGFWGPNGHDGVWHLALINELTHHFPPQNPVFAQFNLLNYHWLSDFLLALVNKITRLPIINLYFQIFPIILAGFLGILTYLFVKKLTKNSLSSWLAVFFAYFGGSFGWLMTLLRGQRFGGESMFWANQSVSFLINPPFALSIILILFGFYLYLDYQKKPTLKLLAILALIFGLLIGIKAYAGVIILVGLAGAAVWEWWRKKKFDIGKLFFWSLIISLSIFLPINHTASSLFIFTPLWFPHTMLAFSDRLGWIRLDQARQAYLATAQWLKWLLAEGLALVIFFVGNLGTRIIGAAKVFSWLKNWKKIDSFQVFFLSCLGVSAIIPLLVIQKGNPWNSIQFFYYFLVFFGILASLWLGEFFQKHPPKSLYHILIYNILLLLLVGLTIPTTLGALKHYLPSRAPARVSFEELEALEFLKKQPQGIVLTYPHDYQLREKMEAPKPLYAYETTAYVSAFSNKTTFLEDEMNLEIMGVNWRPRRKVEEEFFDTKDGEWAKRFLQENDIKYIYLVEGQNFKVNESQLGVEKIFENGVARIYEFRGKI